VATLSPIKARFELRNLDLVRHLKCLEKNYMDFENIYLFVYLFILKQMVKCIAKKDTIQKGQRDLGKTKPTSTKA
jgi:hypothetical protein